jgi:hypothetical protein
LPVREFSPERRLARGDAKNTRVSRHIASSPLIVIDKPGRVSLAWRENEKAVTSKKIDRTGISFGLRPEKPFSRARGFLS